VSPVEERLRAAVRKRNAIYVSEGDDGYDARGDGGTGSLEVSQGSEVTARPRQSMQHRPYQPMK